MRRLISWWRHRRRLADYRRATTRAKRRAESAELEVSALRLTLDDRDQTIRDLRLQLFDLKGRLEIADGHNKFYAQCVTEQIAVREAETAAQSVKVAALENRLDTSVDRSHN